MSSTDDAETADAETADSSGIGLLLGLLSAAGYMLANLGLRGVADAGGAVADVDWAIWVSANKVLPVALAAWTLVGWRALRGMAALPSRRLVLPLIVTGLFMQWGGNVCFQFALSRAGLAVTVPLCFATILMASAVVGRLVLGDRLSFASVLAIGTMIAAIAVLTQGTLAATASMASESVASESVASESVASESSGMWSATLAVAAACLSGIAYGAGGVMIRRCVRGDLSHSATIVVLSTTGVLTLGGTSLLRIGPQQLLATPPDVWLRMLAAGVATALAFFAISGAYQRLTAVKVSLLNASQIAMSAMAGVVLFSEPNTFWLQAGTVLTIVGLILSARRDAPTTVPAASRDVTATPPTRTQPAPSTVE